MRSSRESEKPALLIVQPFSWRSLRLGGENAFFTAKVAKDAKGKYRM
jgi:hypothetical protein